MMKQKLIFCSWILYHQIVPDLYSYVPLVIDLLFVIL
jgi:hypothetical protein